MRQLLSSRRGRAHSVSFLQHSGVSVRIIPSTVFIFLEIPFTDLTELAAITGYTVITACTTYIKYMLTRRAVLYWGR